MLSSAILAVALCVVACAAAAPGDATIADLRRQTCGTGCLAGLYVMAGMIAVIGCSLMCCIFWPSPERISRQERRAIAKKRLRERAEEEEEARAKNEEFDD